MELAEFKELGVPRNAVVEYTRKNDPKYESKGTRPGYFLSLTEELPPAYQKGHPKPPFIEVAHGKDKNGLMKDVEDIPLEDILHLWVVGQSNLAYY